MEHKFLLLTVGLHKCGGKKTTHGEKEKKKILEAFLKLTIHKIKALYLDKTLPPELSLSVRLGNCLFLLWHWALPGPEWKKLTLWC